jgi:error-prone DNA polymerase
VVWEKVFDNYRKEILQSRLLMVEGMLQVEGKVIHVIVKRCFNLTKLLRGLTIAENDALPVTLSRADERTDKPDVRTKTTAGVGDREVFHKGRNFK